jgi:thymidylate synthase
MRQYHELVADTLTGGTYKPNRTGVDTVAAFSHHYVWTSPRAFRS